MQSFREVATHIALPAFAGIYDPRSSFDDDAGSAALAAAFEGASGVTRLADGPLAAARKAEGREPGAYGDIRCLVEGRIYNGYLLAEELGLGADADTETVLAGAYERWGVDMLERLRGAFATLVWNKRTRRGLIAQDQFAARALYYWTVGTRLVFASEIRTLLRLLSRQPSPERVAVVSWLANGDMSGDLTLYEGVRRLGAARYLEFGPDGMQRRRYWYPRYHAPLSLPPHDLREALWEALGDAIRRRAGYGRVGIVMSGGIDSSAVASAATEVLRGSGHDLKGYSTVFPGDPDLDESERINLLTARIGLPSAQVSVHPVGALALAVDYLRTWELPLSGPGYLVEYPLLGLAAEDGVSTVIEGQGGDELFGPTPFLIADMVSRGRILPSLRMVRRFPGAAGAPWRPIFKFWMYYGVEGATSFRLHRAIRRARGAARYAPPWFEPDTARTLLETSEPWRWKKRSFDGPRWWRYLADILTQSREDVGVTDYLRHRAALVGLEAHSPLFDVDLVEFVLRIPPEVGFDPRFDRMLIRECMAGRVPDEVRLSRAKSNLAPLFFKSLSGPDLDAVRRLLGRDAHVYEHVRPQAIQELVANPPALGDSRWLSWLGDVWVLATAESWLRQEADDGFAGRLASGLQRPAWDVIRGT